jgi:hypothetical protein
MMPAIPVVNRQQTAKMGHITVRAKFSELAIVCLQENYFYVFKDVGLSYSNFFSTSAREKTCVTLVAKFDRETGS